MTHPSQLVRGGQISQLSRTFHCASSALDYSGWHHPLFSRDDRSQLHLLKPRPSRARQLNKGRKAVEAAKKAAEASSEHLGFPCPPPSASIYTQRIVGCGGWTVDWGECGGQVEPTKTRQAGD